MLKIKPYFKRIGIAAGVALLTLVAVATTDSWAGDYDHPRRPDSLYVGDAADDTVKLRCEHPKVPGYLRSGRRWWPAWTAWAFIDALVDDAGLSPQGICLSQDRRFLFVAEQGDPGIPGTFKMFTASGKFVADLDLSAALLPPDNRHPRAAVVGPDKLVYVSNAPQLPIPNVGGIGGQVLRLPDT